MPLETRPVAHAPFVVLAKLAIMGPMEFLQDILNLIGGLLQGIIDLLIALLHGIQDLLAGLLEALGNLFGG